MAIVLLILSSLALLAAMLYLSLSVNEFEKRVKGLDTIIQKRYRILSPVKSPEAEARAKARGKA